jgi:hypothetical protein
MTDYERGYEQGKADAMKGTKPVAWRFGSGTWLNREVHWRYIDTLEGSEGLRGLEPLYAAPRPWVGLTDEEIDHAAEQSDNYASFVAGVSFAQAKLKEKNQ